MKVYIVMFLESVRDGRWIILEVHANKAKANERCAEYVRQWDKDHGVRADEHGNTGMHYFWVREENVRQ